MKGTPKSLEEALSNALEDYLNQTANSPLLPIKFQQVFQAHIGDYLAQKFSVAAIRADSTPLNNEDVLALYETVMGKEFVENRRKKF